MRLFTVSDLHIDYESNKRWLEGLSNADYKEDAVIVAGDISDSDQWLKTAFAHLVDKFKHVVFVPGNHDLWITRGPHSDSLEKFAWVMDTCRDYGLITARQVLGTFDITPLFSWYDYSFASLNAQIQQVWADFQCCYWSDGVEAAAQYFHDMNEATNINANASDHSLTTITVSHFLPTLAVLPTYIPRRFDYLWPVLGSTTLGQQVNAIAPRIHIYGHSHVNTQKTIRGTVYVNNALGYPSEPNTRKSLLQIPMSDSPGQC